MKYVFAHTLMSDERHIIRSLIKAIQGNQMAIEKKKNEY